MRSWTRHAAATALAAALATPAAAQYVADAVADVVTPADDTGWNAKHLYDYAQHEAFMAKVGDALGRFDDITVWTRQDGTWEKQTGEYIPVTVHGHAPAEYFKDMRSDMPMMLPTRVEGFSGGDGQSNPYNLVGRMPGDNPEVQWVFMLRKYSIKKPTDDNFIVSGDVAIIGHHPRTGASVFFQFYDPAHPKPMDVVLSPFSGEDGMYFWSPLVTNAKVFQCQRCHNADPFVHSPWVNQVRVSAAQPGLPTPEPMVPSNPLGPFFFIDAQEGGLFAFWEDSLRYLDPARAEAGQDEGDGNVCTTCHRVTPFDMLGLYENSTQYTGVDRPDYKEFALESHAYQTDAYTDLPWMPPVDPADFYAGQDRIDAGWALSNAASAAEVNTLTPEDSTKLARVPRPPLAYQQIMVDRPHQDQLQPGQSVLLVDSRMRANTGGTLTSWRFTGKAGAGPGMQARPVILRRDLAWQGQPRFRVVLQGAPRGAPEAGGWQDVAAAPFALQQGDFLGLMLTNTGSAPAAALVPYTEDDWAKQILADGTTGYPDGVITYRMLLDAPPADGAELVFEDFLYRTYSYEMRTQL